MKHRVWVILLALVLALGAQVSAQASFLPTRSYAEQFTDVTPEDWFYDDVKELFELGLTTGRGASDRYAPNEAVTVAECVTLAARVRSLYEYGDSEAGAAAYAGSGSWYAPYAAYLKSAGALGDELDGAYTQPAKRCEMAHILAQALPEDWLDAINDEAVTQGYASGEYIQDVTEATPYQQDILQLYRWGVLTGMDGTGSFRPDETLQRSQIAAVVARLADSSLRSTLNWAARAQTFSETELSDAALEDLVVSDGSFFSAPSPDDLDAIDADVRYMLSQGQRTLSLKYGKNQLTKADVQQLKTAFLNTVHTYIEQSYNALRCTYSLSAGTVTMTFYCSLYPQSQVEEYRQDVLQAAKEVRAQLWAEGAITAASSQREVALAYYTWLCENCRYDQDADDSSISHSAYGALLGGEAVCDGYTAAYNLLLKLEGIQCTTCTVGSHIWTVAVLDGETVHIDPTWGDQESGILYEYFAMTPQASLDRF